MIIKYFKHSADDEIPIPFKLLSKSFQTILLNIANIKEDKNEV